jgi:Do/DeqQ family serine protease
MLRRFALLMLAATLASLPPAAPTCAQTVPESRAEIALSFAPVVKRVAPAVVNVYAKRVVRQRGMLPFADDPFFRRFFGDNVFGGPRERVQNSLGSGVIVDPSGVIVTNNHVIGGATDIRVQLSDKREFDARVLVADERTDLAVLKLEAGGEQLPALAYADSDDLEVGDLVLAIGNPFGVGQTVTSGIVSALARTRVGVTDYQFFIQTDAAINPGNSGGALVDMRGRLIGINTAIFSRSGGSIGIGFAIPANMARSVTESAASGKVVRPWAGLDLQDVTPDISDTLGFETPRGAIVAAVHPQSPFAKAGLMPGDVIVSANGKPIEDARQFDYRVATMPVGKPVSVDILRGGKAISASAVLQRAPETPPRRETLIEGAAPLTGAVVVNISPAVAEELDLPSAARGVAVAQVKGGPAARLGFRKGDRVLAVNGRKVDDVAALASMLGQGADQWDIQVDRGGRVTTLRVGG